MSTPDSELTAVFCSKTHSTTSTHVRTQPKIPQKPRPAVLMQNSGLGTSLNALASLSLMYGLPALLLVTWRGHRGKDAPEHILTGAITERHLGLLGIPHRVLSESSGGRCRV